MQCSILASPRWRQTHSGSGILIKADRHITLGDHPCNRAPEVPVGDAPDLSIAARRCPQNESDRQPPFASDSVRD